MTIRILVFVSLCWAAAAAEPVSSRFAPPRVGVLVRFERRPSSLFVKVLQQQVDAIFRPSGLDLQWETLSQNKQPGSYDRVVIVEMRGVCNPNWPTAPGQSLDSNVPLGWAMVNDGEVLPYTVVDCHQIARVIADRHHDSTRLTSFATYTRLASRVLAHELMHALLRTAEHHQSDCMRSPLRPSDLEVEPRLQPKEIAALKGIMRPRGEALAQRD